MGIGLKIGLGGLLGLALAGSAGAAPVVLPVGFQVPASGGQPAVDQAWIGLRLAEANRVFAPHGLQFVQAWIRPREVVPAALTRADRDALAAQQQPGVINVQVVSGLLDIHTAGRPRQGVHWKVGPDKARTRFVILAAYSGPGVLAHELGHFLGHPQHSDQPDNLMSYTRTGTRAPFLTPAQGSLMRQVAARLLRSGALVAPDQRRPARAPPER